MAIHIEEAFVEFVDDWYGRALTCCECSMLGFKDIARASALYGTVEAGVHKVDEIRNCRRKLTYYYACIKNNKLEYIEDFIEAVKDCEEL